MSGSRRSLGQSTCAGAKVIAWLSRSSSSIRLAIRSASCLARTPSASLCNALSTRAASYCEARSSSAFSIASRRLVRETPVT
ncbi:hypothetical protein MARPU_11045 [Marichromatium purpuratum 984]|uniref:Uncharacterized protein n=1 Tax=Marichromatium purpuratum 984 TaxID=765910 RepID=W0E471_MARPU|nr:hypothetical protein MARPU_11045 [Marichromatium purpuratum 984]